MCMLLNDIYNQEEKISSFIVHTLFNSNILLIIFMGLLAVPIEFDN